MTVIHLFVAFLSTTKPVDAVRPIASGRRALPDVTFTWSLARGWRMHLPSESIPESRFDRRLLCRPNRATMSESLTTTGT